MNDFLASFRTRRLLCQTLLQLTDRQRDRVAAGDLDEVIEILERKSRVLNRLREGHTEVAAWQDTRDQLPAEHRHECETLLAECENDLQTLQTLTIEDQRDMAARRDETLQKLQQVTAASETHTAYQSSDADDSGSPLLRLNAVH